MTTSLPPLFLRARVVTLPEAMDILRELRDLFLPAKAKSERRAPGLLPPFHSQGLLQGKRPAVGVWVKGHQFHLCPDGLSVGLQLRLSNLADCKPRRPYHLHLSSGRVCRCAHAYKRVPPPDAGVVLLFSLCFPRCWARASELILGPGLGCGLQL